MYRKNLPELADFLHIVREFTYMHRFDLRVVSSVGGIELPHVGMREISITVSDEYFIVARRIHPPQLNSSDGLWVYRIPLSSIRYIRESIHSEEDGWVHSRELEEYVFSRPLMAGKGEGGSVANPNSTINSGPMAFGQVKVIQEPFLQSGHIMGQVTVNPETGQVTVAGMPVVGEEKKLLNKLSHPPFEKGALERICNAADLIANQSLKLYEWRYTPGVEFPYSTIITKDAFLACLYESELYLPGWTAYYNINTQEIETGGQHSILWRCPSTHANKAKIKTILVTARVALGEGRPFTMFTPEEAVAINREIYRGKSAFTTNSPAPKSLQHEP